MKDLGLITDLKDFLADVPNERGVGDGMKAWAKELLDRLNAASTGNILDASARGDALPYEGETLPAVTRDCPNCGRDLSTNSSAAILDVADRATGNAPVTDGLQVGSNTGVSASSRVDAPEEIKFAGERAEATRDPHESRKYGYANKEQRAKQIGNLSGSLAVRVSTEAEVCDSRRDALSTAPRQMESDRCAYGSADATAKTSPAIQISTPRTITCSVPGKDGTLFERVTRVYNDAIWPELLAAYMVIFAPDFVTKGYEQ